jgi:hypothetical protein
METSEGLSIVRHENVPRIHRRSQSLEDTGI